MRRPEALAAAILAAFALAAVLLEPARAFPPPPPPAAATPSPTPTPNPAAYLAVGAPIEFILDDTVSSKTSQPGSTVRVHLSKALVVGSVELAPAGSPGTIKIVSTRKALAPDVDGAVQLLLEPLQLPGHGPLPVSLTRSYLTSEHTAGQDSTEGMMDTVEDILLPAAVLYQALRKGHEMVLRPGFKISARVDASIDTSRAPVVVIATPPPMQLQQDVPHSRFTPIPLYTVPTPPPRSTPKPTPTPTSAPSGSPAAAR